jgi:hypothetical protein
MKMPTLDEIAAMDDTGLSSLLGLDQKLSEFKKELTKTAGLTGKAKTLAEEKLQSRLAPRVDGYDLRYIREDALRESKKSQTGKEALADPSPASIDY